MERFEEDLKMEGPSDEIACMRCVHRMPDLEMDGKTIVSGAKSSYCAVYTEDTGGKPIGILFDGEKCEYMDEI